MHKKQTSLDNRNHQLLFGEGSGTDPQSSELLLKRSFGLRRGGTPLAGTGGLQLSLDLSKVQSNLLSLNNDKIISNTLQEDLTKGHKLNHVDSEGDKLMKHPSGTKRMFELLKYNSTNNNFPLLNGNGTITPTAGTAVVSGFGAASRPRRSSLMPMIIERMKSTNDDMPIIGQIQRYAKRQEERIKALQ
jgi:hypothetical protein